MLVIDRRLIDIDRLASIGYSELPSRDYAGVNQGLPQNGLRGALIGLNKNLTVVSGILAGCFSKSLIVYRFYCALTYEL